MKRLPIPLLFLAVAGLALNAAALSGADLRAASGNLAQFAEHLRGADPAQVAAALNEAVSLIQASSLDAQQKERQLALLVAATVATGGDMAAGRVAGMVAAAPAALQPGMVAAAVVAAGGRSPQMLDAILAALGETSPAAAAARSAAGDPTSVLSPDTVAAVRELILGAGALVVPVVPLQEPTTVPLVPPLIPPGEPGEPEPPVAERYPGQ